MNFLEDKACLIVDDGIVQAACRADNGDAPIAHGDHLRKSARLVTRGHEEHIGAGVNLTRKPRIVKTMVDEVREVLDWVGYDPACDDGVRARFAGKPDGNGGTLKLISGDG